MIRILISVLFLCFSPFARIGAQGYVVLEKAPKALVKLYDAAVEADKAREMDKAIEKLDKAIKIEPTFIDAYILKATVLYGGKRTGESLEALSKAIAMDSVYNVRSLYSLARLYEMEGRYNQGLQALNAYIAYGDLNAERGQEMNDLGVSWQFKADLVANPVPFTPKPLPGQVNTEHDEVLPSVAISGEYMVFTRRERGDEDLYISNWQEENGEWGEGQPILEVNSVHNEAAQTISADGRVLAFTSCGRPGSIGGCDIYLSIRLADGSWTEPRNPTEINSKHWDGQPALTADGRGLYFSSARGGGQGQRDIWYSELASSGKWSVPENLGSVVNSPGNESSPFLHFDDRTLYMMSDGHPGMGDYDIFISRHEIEGWTTPLNIGYPINTSKREGALSVHPNGTIAYFTVESVAGGTMDIHQFDLPENMRPTPVSYLEGVIYDFDSKMPLQAEVIIYALEDSSRTYRFYSNEDGSFVASLSHGGAYGVHVNARDYVFYSNQFELDSETPYGKKLLKVGLSSLTKDEAEAAPVVLHNVEFETGSAVLTRSSATELKRLADLLIQFPESSVEIRGHTDNIGDPDSNLKLSEERARSVLTWLLEQGLSDSRLSFIGLGETEPIADNDTDIGRSKNRRTEFVFKKSNQVKK